jgi:hypothetical protein
MNSRMDRPLAGHRSCPGSLGRLAAWVNAKWRARRARRLEEETVVCLSTMDAKLIHDIGMDVDRLSELTPRRRGMTGSGGAARPRHSGGGRRS